MPATAGRDDYNCGIDHDSPDDDELYNDHRAHLVVYHYDRRYLYDPIHHFIVRRPDDHVDPDDEPDPQRRDLGADL